ncbi:hypothetical protein ACOMHN_059285 [Nucella lapillus]
MTWHTLLPCLLVFMTTASLAVQVPCPLPCTCSTSRIQCEGSPQSKFTPGGKNTTHILTSIPQHLPNNITVTSLTIMRMRIQHVMMSDFNHLLLLQKLDLRQNRIDKLDDQTFQHLSALKSLLISDNFLQELSDDTFVGLVRLKSLDVSRNRLVEVAGWSFLPLKNLEVLNLAHNEIEHIQDEAFEGLYRLQTLILTRNRLMALSEAQFKPLYSLETLMLDSCSIQVVEFHTFSPLGRLSRLSLANNPRLEFLLAEAFVSKSQSMLEFLSLRQTGIREVSVAVLKTLSQLRTLDLSGTLIPVLRNCSFIYLHKLVNLTLDGLPRLYRIEEDAFFGLSSLKYLTITNNRLLTHISDGNFRNMSSLRYLDLSNNSMETFPQGLADWQSLAMLDLRGNPLHCDCSVSWMLTALLNPTAVSENSDNPHVENMCNTIHAINSKNRMELAPETWTKQIACRGPSRFEGRCLLSLSAEDLCSSHTLSDRLPLGVLVVGMCCVSLLMCVLLYKFRRRMCSVCRGGYGYQMHRNRADSRRSSLVDVLEMEAT